MDFLTKSFQKDELLTSWTLLQHICPHFWAWLLNTIERTYICETSSFGRNWAGETQSCCCRNPTQLTLSQPGGQIMPPKYWRSNSKTSSYTLNESKSLPTLFRRGIGLRSWNFGGCSVFCFCLYVCVSVSWGQEYVIVLYLQISRTV